MKTLKNILQKIEQAETKLCHADNNLRYIKALKSLNYWLLQLSTIAPNSAEYVRYFLCVAGWSTFDRVQNSILEYNYGVKPF